MASIPSILDKIISSKETSEVEQFHPAEVLSQLLKELSAKEIDIVNRRHFAATSDGREQTLEEIGKLYHVTRERIRQIEKAAITTMRKGKHSSAPLHAAERAIMTILTHHGGIMEEQALLRAVLSYAGQTTQNRTAVLFLLQEMLNDRFASVSPDKTFRAAWKVKLKTLDFTHEVIRELLAVIDTLQVPTKLDTIYERFRVTPFAVEHSDKLNVDVMSAVMGLSQAIGRNPFDEYGRTAWGSITPRRMNDKIALILRKEGKPLHFVEIARRINEAGFDDRTAYPPTVHNELILNDQYVLIGRGIYALREWGYKPGVVADVLVDILQEAQRPMSREELVAEVLKRRMVKRNTIHLALTNRSRFRRQEDGMYVLVAPEEPKAPLAHEGPEG